ncbi:hypothetical protein FOA43_001402 [Brettanomyces nanus]|uniref:Uncharacterized protein n=1 Tax=Eeniella nana TaxID=13502 RepID=A0A875RXB1_EENNA|nr:uncharacterized protein FOA43_001402 [Brettanomyces nanus]QPG74081.1 hypothetical protein FOA43_001402 [Brettanomyces nanus]
MSTYSTDDGSKSKVPRILTDAATVATTTEDGDEDRTSVSPSIESYDSRRIGITNSASSSNNIQPSRSNYSLSSSLSRFRTVLSTHVGHSLQEVVSNVKDDNVITNKNLSEARQTDLGRILTRPDFSDAMRVATHTDQWADELAGVRPDEERVVKKLTLKAEATEISGGELLGEEEAKKYPPVDKGYAWIVCMAEFIMIASTWGSVTSFGVFISFWMNHNTFDGADPMNYALSSSITLFLAQALAPVAMISFNMIGLKFTIATGTILFFAGYMLCSYCTELWQLYCTQGILIGSGFSLIFNPSIVILSTWFSKHRGFASGIVVCGAGVGGVAFALGAQDLIDRKDDFRWAIRMICITTLCLNCIVGLLVKERVPVKRELTWTAFKTHFKIILNYRVMQHWHVIAISLWFAMGIISYIVITYSLASYATFIGLSEASGSHVTAIFNGSQAVGRAFIGALGDRYGRVNVALIINVIVIILIFAFFINCSNFGTLVAFSVVSGLVTGWCQTLNQAIMPDSVPMADFPSVWSYENIIVGSFCLFAEVVALKLRSPGSAKPFLRAQLFAGFMVVGSLICLTPVREWKIRNKILSRLEDCQEELKTLQTAIHDNEKADHDENAIIIQQRIQRYQALLGKGIRGYLKRLLYPVKV